MSRLAIFRGDEALAILDESKGVSSDECFFQGRSWLDLWGHLPDYSYGIIALLDGDRLSGYMPFCTRDRGPFHQCFSMPMGTVGGSVAFNSRGESKKEIDRFFVEFLKESRFSRVNIVEYAQTPNESLRGMRCRALNTHIVRLTGDDGELVRRFSENHRRNIAKLSGSQFEIRSVTCDRDIAEYYRLVDLTSRRHGRKSRYSIDFFRALFRRIPPSEIVWQIAYVDSIPQAGHLYFVNAATAFYWDGCSSDQGLESGANFFLFWTNIRAFRDAGFSTLDLRPSPPEATELERFKSGWGAEKSRFFEYDSQTSLFRFARALTGRRSE